MLGRSGVKWALSLLLVAAPPIPALAAGKAAARDGWVDTGHASLHYRIDRAGPDPLVFIHEMGTSLASWDEVIPAITAKGRGIVRYDVRGFGLSEKITGPITIAEETADLAALLDRIAPGQRVTLIGSALGGAIALAFAAEHPAQVGAVVAIGPAAYPAPRPEAEAAADKIAAAPISTYVDGAINMIYPVALRTPARLARFRGIQLATDPRSLAETTRMVARTGFSDILPQVRVRTVIVATTLFKGRSASSLRDLAALIPGASFIELPTGHLAAIESPGATAELINRFVAGNGAR